MHITRKTMKETVVRFTCQAFKHLVNEWQGKMVLFGKLVQPPIVDADSPTVLHPSRNQLLLLIFFITVRPVFSGLPGRDSPLGCQR